MKVWYMLCVYIYSIIIRLFITNCQKDSVINLHQTQGGFFKFKLGGQQPYSKLVTNMKIFRYQLKDTNETEI